MRPFIHAVAFTALFLTEAAAPAAALGGSATVDNIVGAINIPGGGAATYTIPHIEATGTALTDSELKGLFAVEDSTPVADRLAKLTAAAINIPEIDVEETIGPI